MNKETFIERAEKVHGKGTYIYDLIPNEINTKKKINIICPIHGVFEQFASAHLSGKGCNLCANKKRNLWKQMTNEEFIDAVIKVQGNRYDLSNVHYINNHTLVQIICPIHGKVDIWPKTLLKGGQCKYCAKHHYTTEEIKEKILNIYTDNELNLDNLFFNGFRTRVEVKCNKCGKIHTNVLLKTLINGTFACDCQKHNPYLETQIKLLLSNNNLEFIQFYKTKWLDKQSLDYFLPKYNIAIECQGKQHFGEGGWTKDKTKREEYFKIQLERDERKYKLCKENGIQLLYYSNMKPKFKYFDEVHTNLNEIITIIKNKIDNYGR